MWISLEIPPSILILPNKILSAAAPYYPLSHPNLHVIRDGPLDLDRLPRGQRGRFDEIGRLQHVALSIPHALAKEWRFSPSASMQGHDVKVEKAMKQHGNLAKFLVQNGVHVYLSVPPSAASEAVYNTDIVTGFAQAIALSMPKHEARLLERIGYKGSSARRNLDMASSDFGEPGNGPIEFGDIILHTSIVDKTFTVFQGCNSWRSDDASIRRMSDVLKQANSRGLLGTRGYKHVPVWLSGKNTLHLDYVFNYAGFGEKRVLIVHTEGLAEPDATIAMASKLLDVPPARIITIDEVEMLAGACNLCSLSPDEVMCIESDETQRVIGLMVDAGLQVYPFAYDQISQKDGTIHCSIGQLSRQYPM